MSSIGSESGSKILALHSRLRPGRPLSTRNLWIVSDHQGARHIIGPSLSRISLGSKADRHIEGQEDEPEQLWYRSDEGLLIRAAFVHGHDLEVYKVLAKRPPVTSFAETSVEEPDHPCADAGKDGLIQNVKVIQH